MCTCVANLNLASQQNNSVGDINRVEKIRVRPHLVSSLRSGGLFSCSECKYVSHSEQRFEQHFKQPRHVNNYRDMAYKEPKKRQMWLKIWFAKLEAAETENNGAFEFEEEADDDEVDQDTVFRLPNSAEVAAVNAEFFQSISSERKVSSTSSCSTTSFMSDFSTDG